MKKILLLFVLSMMTSCGTYQARFASDKTGISSTIYPATSYDNFEFKNLWYCDEYPFVRILIPVIIVDYIPSIITDTIMLPLDVKIIWDRWN